MDSNTIGGKWLDYLNADLAGSHRSCAVLAGAMLDDRLRELVGLYLLPQTKREEDRLLGRGGVVETFSSRIELAARLNLITEPMAKALDWIREIRNNAAHKADFSFSINRTRDQVANTIGTLKLRERAFVLLEAPYTGTKGHFVAATVPLVSFLQIEASEVKTTAHNPVNVLEHFTVGEKDG